MKGPIIAGLAAIAAQRVAGHATWQELWVNGVDMGASCVRLPNSNSPVTDVTSNDVRCNANQGAPNYKCVVPAGGTVTIEMHQQPGDRSCANEAIGGAHYGPVQAYLSKVDNAITADGSAGFFKIYSDSWAKLSSTSQGSDDYWGTKDLTTSCGKLDVKIPSTLASGDYLLRAEAIALHSASSPGGAQHYMSCYQLTITGSGSDKPATVNFPGAYKATDPGLEINIYQPLSTYIAPGPSVISGGTVVQAGKGGSAATKTGGDIKTLTGTGGAGGAAPTLVTKVSSSAPAPTSGSGSGGSGACSVAVYGQCGGTGYTGCTTCASGSTCKAQGSYYSQCTP